MCAICICCGKSKEEVISDKLEGGGGAVQGSFTEEGFWLSSERWEEFLAVEVEGPSSPKEGGTPPGGLSHPQAFPWNLLPGMAS